MSQLFNKYPGDDKSWLNWHFFVQIVPLYIASMSQLSNKYPGDDKSWLNWHFFVQIVPLYVASMSQLFNRHPSDSKSSIFSHNLPHQCRSFSSDIPGTQNRPFSPIIYHINIVSMSQLFSRHPLDSKSSIFSHNLPY